MYFAEDALADAERAREYYRRTMEKFRACASKLDDKIYDASEEKDLDLNARLFDEIQELASDAQDAIDDYRHAMAEYAILSEKQEDENPPDSIWSLGLVGMF